MIAVSQPIFFLLVALIRILDPVGEVSVDYFQSSTPVGELSIRPLSGDELDVYQVSFEPGIAADKSSREGPSESSDRSQSDAGAGFPLRIEQSDLYNHQYIVNPAGGPAVLLDLTAVNSWLSGGEWESSGELAGPLHLIDRAPLMMLAAESEEIILIAR